MKHQINSFKISTVILTMGLFSSLFGCAGDSVPQPITKPVEKIIPIQDQADRRAKSEAFCISKNIPVYKNPNALFVEPEKNVTLRTKDEVVDRAIALSYLELKSEGADKEMLAAFDQRYNVMAKLTPKEKEFALNDHPEQQQITDANWRAESYHVMLWALGYIDSLKSPGEVCDIAEDIKFIGSRSEQEFRDHAKLRSKTEILDQADLILRLDWACVSARVKNQPAPGGLDSSVVYERHYSLNWLICYLNQQWDDVQTDT
jgi:hypothetical protein